MAFFADSDNSEDEEWTPSSPEDNMNTAGPEGEVGGESEGTKEVDHLLSHKPKKPFLCDQCPGTFSNTKSLKDHQREYHSGRTWTCHNCGKEFRGERLLKSHLKRCVNYMYDLIQLNFEFLNEQLCSILLQNSQGGKYKSQRQRGVPMCYLWKIVS